MCVKGHLSRNMHLVDSCLVSLICVKEPLQELVRGTWKAWHCSAMILTAGGSNVANRAEPAPCFLLLSFSSLSPPVQPLLPGCHHRPHSFTSQAKGRALAPWAALLPRSPEDKYGLDGKCDCVCYKIIKKCDSILASPCVFLVKKKKTVNRFHWHPRPCFNRASISDRTHQRERHLLRIHSTHNWPWKCGCWGKCFF